MKKGQSPHNQNQLLQIRLTQQFKHQLATAARLRGLTMSGYIKLVLSQHLHQDETIHNLSLSLQGEKSVKDLDQLINLLASQKRLNFQEALNLINKITNEKQQ